MDNEKKVNSLIQSGINYLNKNEIKIAEGIFSEILKENPNNFLSLFNLSLIFVRKKEFIKAKELLLKAINVNPKNADAHNNLGNVNNHLKNYKDAENCYLKAININPNYKLAYNNLGNIYKTIGKKEKAEEFYNKAITIDPNNAGSYYNLGKLYQDLKIYNKAIEFYKKSIEINPSYLDAYNNLGIVHEKIGNYEEAKKFFFKIIDIDPNYSKSYYNLANVFKDLGDADKSIDLYLKALDLKPNFFQCYNNLLMSVLYSYKNYDYLKIAKSFDTQLKESKEKNFKGFFNKNEKKLNIGFVSADFREHPVGLYLLDFIQELSKKNLNLYAYYNNLTNDDITKNLKKIIKNWRDVFAKSDNEIIDVIRKDNIDILFDLSGHTAGNKLNIFKKRCAPIQITWIGCASSTGVSEMDYIIGDPFASPSKDQFKFTEQILNLNKIWLTLSTSNLNSVSRSNKTENNSVTFGAFTNVSKINDKVILTWSKILKKIKNSKLVLKSSDYDNNQIKLNILKKFDSHEVADKLIFEGRSPRLKFLETYNKIDIALDTFSYNGGITTFEAAYMGVPTITMINDFFMLRCGESINKNLGMDNWIALNEDDYISKALQFSENKKFLINLKKELRTNSMKSSLFNIESFTNNFYEMLLNINKN